VPRIFPPAKEERRFPTGCYEFVINRTDNDRRAVLAAPYVAIVRHS
jgi:hypothetical protein